MYKSVENPVGKWIERWKKIFRIFSGLNHPQDSLLNTNRIVGILNLHLNSSLNMLTVPTLSALKSYIGKPIGTTAWKTISQEMIDDFARATQDFQWIHEESERTRRESPFGGPIAHGFLTLSLVSKFIAELLLIESAKMGVNYGLNKVRFTSHVPAGSKVRLHATLLKMDPIEGGAKLIFSCTMEKENSERPACVAEFIGLIME